MLAHPTLCSIGKWQAGLKKPSIRDWTYKRRAHLFWRSIFPYGNSTYVVVTDWIVDFWGGRGGVLTFLMLTFRVVRISRILGDWNYQWLIPPEFYLSHAHLIPTHLTVSLYSPLCSRNFTLCWTIPLDGPWCLDSEWNKSRSRYLPLFFFFVFGWKIFSISILHASVISSSRKLFSYHAVGPSLKIRTIHRNDRW